MSTNKVFVSYAHVDRQFVDRMIRALPQYAFVYDESINPGDNIIGFIANSIKNSSAMVYVISRESSRRKWTTTELSIALARSANEKFGIIPVLISGGDEIPSIIKNLSYIDFRDDSSFGDNIKRLDLALKKATRDTGVVTTAELKIPFEEMQADIISNQLQYQIKTHEFLLEERKRALNVMVRSLIVSIATTVAAIIYSLFLHSQIVPVYIGTMAAAITIVSLSLGYYLGARRNLSSSVPPNIFEDKRGGRYNAFASNHRDD